jgi:hypothetical protein
MSAVQPQPDLGVSTDEQAPGFARAIDAPLLAELYAYWTAKRGARFAPSRAEIDPVEIPRLLPHLMLVDIVDGGARLLYRLAGTEIESRFGCRMGGRYVDELMRGRYNDYIHELYRELLATRRALYSESAYGPDGNSPLYTRRLMLPLSNDGRRVDMVLAGQIFTYRSSLAPTTVLTAQDRFADDGPRIVAAGGA